MPNPMRLTVLQGELQMRRINTSCTGRQVHHWYGAAPSHSTLCICPNLVRTRLSLGNRFVVPFCTLPQS